MMHRTPRLMMATSLFTLVASCAHVPAADPKIELRSVKYDELIKEVRGLKGKVVVVDVWADFCVPCKKAFPHLVQLQREYGQKGLVALSVTVDDPKDMKARERAVQFLERVKAYDVINLHLDEEAAFWQAKLRTDGPPLVFVFDRDNRIALRQPVGEEAVDYAAIEKKVQELLKK
jgi:thiol-disulfide isomerase/thioredoxin